MDNNDTEILPAEYSDAFNEVAGPGEVVTDDQAMGISTPDSEAAVAQTEADQAGEVQSENAESSANVQNEAIENGGESVGAPGAAAAAVGDAEEAGMTPAQIQSKRTHEGRMRKMQEQLDVLSAQSKAKDDTPADALAQAVEKAAGDDDQAEAAADVVGQLQDGSLSPEEAMKQLSEDFGEDFVKMISVIVAKQAADVANKAASDAVGKVSEEVKEVTSQMADVKERQHFETIGAAVPDFFDQVKTPEFTKFAETADEETKRVISSGTAKEVIAMMKKFKAAQQPATPVIQVEDPALAAAEGVRSGSRLPDKPAIAGKDDFEGAWSEAAAS